MQVLLSLHASVMYLQLYLLFVYEYARILFKIGHDGWSPLKRSRQGFSKFAFVRT